MSFLIGSYPASGKGCIKVERIGGNGAGRPWCAILLAGYAAGNWPESDRARQWIEVKPYRWKNLDTARPEPVMRPDLPTELNTADDVRKVIATNLDDSQWFALKTNRWRYNDILAIRSARAKRPTCPVLASLVRLCEAACIEFSPRSKLTPSETRALLAAHEGATARLRANCWYDKLMRINAVIESAVAVGGIISVS